MSPSEVGAEDASDFERELCDRAHELCERVGAQCLSCASFVAESDVYDVYYNLGEVAAVRILSHAWCRHSRAEFATDNECDGWEGSNE
jgi:hypothetical protein|nr:MAG TPA_asm: hypothetical protein [Caudoviricetes sp.]